MSQDDVVARITKNPKFQQFVSTRNVYSNIMTMLMMVVYFGYILLIAFNKPFLATKMSAGGTISIGIPMGIGVLVFTIIITWIYVRRANTEFDATKDEIVKEASK
jgi:uncharacterized membrane protein (DUF485 family)